MENMQQPLGDVLEAHCIFYSQVEDWWIKPVVFFCLFEVRNQSYLKQFQIF